MCIHFPYATKQHVTLYLAHLGFFLWNQSFFSYLSVLIFFCDILSSFVDNATLNLNIKEKKTHK